MIRLGKAFTLVSLLCATIFSGLVVAQRSSLKSLNAKHLEAVKRGKTSARRAGPGNARSVTETSTPSGVKNITFSNPKAFGVYTMVHASGRWGTELAIPSSRLAQVLMLHGRRASIILELTSSPRSPRLPGALSHSSTDSDVILTDTPMGNSLRLVPIHQLRLLHPVLQVSLPLPSPVHAKLDQLAQP